MAKHPYAPFKDCAQPAPGLQINYGAGGTFQQVDLGVVCGLAAYSSGAGKSGKTVGASTRRSVHAIQIFDILQNTGQGRRVTALTVQDDTNPDAIISTINGVALQGNAGADENVDPPDIPIMGGAGFVADGVVRCDEIQSVSGSLGQQIPVIPNMMGQNVIAAFTNHFLDDGGVQTTQPVPPPTPQIQLLPPVANGMKLNDAFYFGADGPFSGIQFGMQTPGVGTWVITWEYWNGAAWVALPSVVDATADFKAQNTNANGQTPVEWDVPTNWATSTEGPSGGLLAYWARARVSTADLLPTTQPIATFTQPGRISISGTVAVPYATSFGVTGSPAQQTWLAGTYVGDAYYIADAATFQGVSVQISTAMAGGGSLIWEYWDGTVWSPLSILSDSTIALTQTGTVTWTVPGNWTSLNSAGGISNYPAPNMLNGFGQPIGFTGFYVRARTTGAATTPAVHVSGFWNYVNATSVVGQRYTGCAVHIGDDPHSGATPVVPGVIGWGIPLPPGIKADSTGLYTFYDPVRNIHSKRFVLATQQGGLVGAPSHSFPNVTQVAIWSDTTQNATLVSTLPSGSLAVPTPWAGAQAVIIGNDAGAPVTYDEALADTDALRNESIGFWRTASVHRRRMWLAGATTSSTSGGRGATNLANRVIWSEFDNPHHYQNLGSFAFLDVDPDDGDEIVAIRSLGDVLLILKTRSAHILTGNPQGTGQIGLQVRRVADIGCIAKRSAVVIHGRCYFLSQDGVYTIDRTGQITPVAISEPIQPIITGLKRSLIDKSSATYDPTQGLYILSVPGLIQQMRGCSDPAQDVNDGSLVYDIQRGLWCVWPGIYACSLAVAPKDETDSEVWVGDYWGGVQRMTDLFADNPAPPGLRYCGNIGASSSTGGSSSLIHDPSTAGLIASNETLSRDGRNVNLELVITSGRLAGTRRRVIGTSINIPTSGWIIAPPLLDVSGLDGATYEVGPVPYWVESGDLDFGAPGQEKAARGVKTFLRKPITLKDAIDYAVSPDDSLDPDAVNYYGADTVDSNTTQPAQVDLPPEPGSTQRLRMQGSMASSRPNVRSIEVDLVDLGERRA